MAENIGSSTLNDSHDFNKQVLGVDASLPQRSWRQLGLHGCIKIFIIAALFYYLFHNEIQIIVSRWLSDSSWSHGF
ncbi:MAG: hypothetical protein KAQ89_01005, partial [Planctomycetes bacterium]|nr:hypothetical protein [Planctomycetota bacterium]